MSLSNVFSELFNDNFFDDPYPTYRMLREKAPAYFDEQSGMWLITRYADVDRVTNDFEIFSSCRGNVTVDSPMRVGKTLGSLDPPRHDELRRVIQRALSPARMNAVVPIVREKTRNSLAKLRDREVCDFVADVSKPLLFEGIGRLLGLDEAAAARSAELAAGLFRHNDGPLGAVLPPERFVEIGAFLREELDGRQEMPGDDLFSVLLEAKRQGAPLNEDEIVANLSTVLLAGNASAGHLFPNIIHALWLHPDERRKVLDDPNRISAAIEESVRWDTSTQSFARQVMKDVNIGGVVIPRDSRAVIFYASANRDSEAIEQADHFDIDRRRVKHFGFGMGPHVCAGAFVARSMLKTIMEEIIPFFGAYELDVASANRAKHVMVRGFTNLPIHW
jgi:cytochrome P450